MSASDAAANVIGGEDVDPGACARDMIQLQHPLVSVGGGPICNPGVERRTPRSG